MTSDDHPQADPAPPAGDLLADVAKATSLREGREGVATVLRIVASDGPLALRDLARLVRMPLPVVSAIRRELETLKLLERGQGVALSATGRLFAREQLGLEASQPEPAEAGRSPRPPRLRPDDDAGDTLNPVLAPLLPAMQAHLADGPKIDVTLDQAPCTAETALRRAFAMHQAGALAGRRILLLGDDDSLSIAIGLVAGALAAPPRRLTVLEIDPARLAHLTRGAARIAFAFERIAHDMRDPVPEALRGGFDVVATDPPYTLPGMALFVARGIEALAAGPGLKLFLSYADLSPDDRLDLQARLTELGLAVLRMRPSFNRYGGASILGSVGQLIELETTSRTAAPLAGQRFDGAIYTGELRPRLRRYRCKACSTLTPVGADQAVTTIEALKEAGCPQCGAHSFERQRGGRKGRSGG
ncbi:bis-aminopropyl spermidine synthase family protein [Aurantimonas marianensis]|uniref:Bis-aminopropyl spermidine synthase family protein n=1 Tax=Aurantimonas marianensis TaxID=2920428 RepID=A0A9X2KF63_9HYPH|nr:bis-aminopropyl spermidine synthase family protein [Aurantimonas marianensis]MCP3055000.1 bis-aminopropyl spermidine synthase family protein [Aurantimonas marianensis]